MGLLQFRIISLKTGQIRGLVDVISRSSLICTGSKITCVGYFEDVNLLNLPHHAIEPWRKNCQSWIVICVLINQSRPNLDWYRSIKNSIIEIDSKDILNIQL